MSCRVNEWKGRRKKNNKFEWCQNAKDVDGRTDGRSTTGLSFFFLLYVWYFFYYFLFLKIFSSGFVREREREKFTAKNWRGIERYFLLMPRSNDFLFARLSWCLRFSFSIFFWEIRKKKKKGRLDYPAYNTVFLPAGFSSFYFIFSSASSSSSCCV